MKIYQTKEKKIYYTSHKDVYKRAFGFYKEIKKGTKRRPYIRSAYFNKDKVFLQLFWQHLHEKNFRDRARRLRYFYCAIDLIMVTINFSQKWQNEKGLDQIGAYT